MKQSIMTSYIVAVQSFGELNCIFSDFHWKWLWACRSVTSSLNTQLAGQGVRCFSHNCISLISASKVIVLIPILTARDDSELNSSAVSLWKCYVLTSSASVTKCPTVTVESLGLPSFDLSAPHPTPSKWWVSFRRHMAGFHWKWLGACCFDSDSLKAALADWEVDCSSNYCISLKSASKVFVSLVSMNKRDDTEPCNSIRFH